MNEDEPYNFHSNYGHLTVFDYELMLNAVVELSNHRAPTKHEIEVARKLGDTIARFRV